MTKIILETTDGEFVVAAEVEAGPPDLIVWNDRYFLLDHLEPKRDERTYTEVEPMELPFEIEEARPADDETEPDNGRPYE